VHQVEPELADQCQKIHDMAADADGCRTDHDHAMQRRNRGVHRARLMVGRFDAFEHAPVFGPDQQQFGQSPAPRAPEQHGAGAVDRFEAEAIPAGLRTARHPSVPRQGWSRHARWSPASTARTT
jgi:hypothetical protein